MRKPKATERATRYDVVIRHPANDFENVYYCYTEQGANEWAEELRQSSPDSVVTVTPVL